jgi:hypothetical protein
LNRDREADVDGLQICVFAPVFAVRLASVDSNAMITYVPVRVVPNHHRDFLLKPELLRAISDLGFEHPSEGALYHRTALFLDNSHPKMLIHRLAVLTSCAPHAVP